MLWYDYFSSTDFPVPCGNKENCTCYHNEVEKLNVSKCSGPLHTNINDVIDNIPNGTNWLILDNTTITELCGLHDSLNESVTHLSLMHSDLNHICDDTLDMILATVTSLNLKGNKLNQMSPRLNSRTSNLTELWLGGNPIHCDCSMTWMIDFLTNSSLPSGNNLVKDNTSVVCTDPVYYGTPVYMLNPVNMGCHPNSNKPIWIEIEVAGSFAGGVILILLMYHKRTRIRWIWFKYTDRLIGAANKGDDLSGIEYDAFLSYRYILQIVLKDVYDTM